MAEIGTRGTKQGKNTSPLKSCLADIGIQTQHDQPLIRHTRNPSTRSVHFEDGTFSPESRHERVDTPKFDLKLRSSSPFRQHERFSYSNTPVKS